MRGFTIDGQWVVPALLVGLGLCGLLAALRVGRRRAATADDTPVEHDVPS